jgi:hypothetical protein
MKRFLIASIGAGAAALTLLWFAPSTLSLTAAQEEAAQTSAPGSVPRLADGHPDFSGVWWGGNDIGGGPIGGRGRGGAQGTPPPSFTSLYQPSAAERAETLSDKDDPTLKCIPTAFGTLNVRLWDVGAVGQIISTPEFVVMLTETYHAYQLIPTDGRPHRDVVPPSYRGDSVGHWEGDTFVVDTTNFTDDTWMYAEGRVTHHSGALRIVERYRRLDANTLEIEAIVEDPGVLTGPWTVPTQTLELAPFDQLLPLNCLGTETLFLMEGAANQDP